MRNKTNLIPAILALSLASAGVGQTLPLRNNSILDSLQSITASTIPANGDLNPYGVAFVPPGFPAGGTIAPGDVLVSNFNSNSNLQGTGTTIVSVTPAGQQALFATAGQASAVSKLFGLNTALGVLSRGFVIAGNLPVTYPGGVATPQRGALQVFDRNGKEIATIQDPVLLDSPWDLTIYDNGAQAQVFVSNVLSGTVTRLNLAVGPSQVTVMSKTLIGSGYAHALNPAAVVVGPTGLAYDPNSGILYVASTGDNEIFGIANASSRGSSGGPGFVVFSDSTNLHGPLGLVLGANGNLITANGDAVNPGGTPNELVEFTPQGLLVAQYELDGGAPGGAFGVATISSGSYIYFAAVDDDLNTVSVWTLPVNF